jgi:xylose dehydrogenase (NAD/NADP)
MRQSMEIVGETGVIGVREMWVPGERADFELRREGAGTDTVGVGGHDQIQCMLENFSHYVLDGEPVRPDSEEAVKTLRVLDALARSAREGRAVEIGPA